MRSIIIDVFSRFLAIHDKIKDVIRVLFPICWEERHHISSVALFLSQIPCLIFTSSFNEYARLPVLLNIVLHLLVLRRVIRLLEVSLLTKYLVSQRNFLSSGRSVGDLLWLELFISLQE